MLQNLTHDLTSTQGQLTKEVSSLTRQLAAEREQANTYKLLYKAPEQDELQQELLRTKSKYSELKRLFQMQQVGAVSGHVSFRSSNRHSRSVTVGSEGENMHEEVSVHEGRPRLAATLRNIQDENRRLKNRIKAANNVIREF
jgi:hypothetical protein